MSIIITAATGHLGRLVVEELLRRGVPGGEVVATGRDTSRLADLADRGVQVRRADYTDPASLREAFTGAQRLLLVSSSEVGSRLEQHRNAITAAGDAGVGLLAYTSMLHAGTATTTLARDHRATELVLAESGLPHVLLRNGWYVENYTDQLPTFLAHGIAGAAGDGLVSAATRQDYAEAAAAVLTAAASAGATYELGGDPFTLTELAAVISAAVGQPVGYTDLSEADYRGVLLAAGLPEPYAALLADADRGMRAGELLVEGTHRDDLRDLIGRSVTPLADAVGAALRQLQGATTG